MSKIAVKENEFFGAPGGSGGAVNYQTPVGTAFGPYQTQNPNQFAHSDLNKSVNQMSNTTKEMPSSGSIENNLDAIYAKKDTPSPDEVITGIKYELGQQIKKDKRKAKENVLANLRKDPHYYGKLKMLNIDDKSMVDNMSENIKNPITHGKFTPNIEETKKIFSELAKSKDTKYVVNSGIVDVIQQMVKEKKARSNWRHESKQS
jgi:hypothetical protein